MNLGPTNLITIDKINEIIKQESLWYENDERFVIIEKFELSYFEMLKHLESDSFVFENNKKEIHRNNGNPAIVTKSLRAWYKNGKRHRNNGRPALIRSEYELKHIQYINSKQSLEEYWVNNCLHRENDLPAVIFNEKHSYWYIEGKLHRNKNKPAVINGNFLHYFNNGIIYKSEVKYDNKIVNWIIRNPFGLSLIVFILLLLITFCF